MYVRTSLHKLCEWYNLWLTWRNAIITHLSTKSARYRHLTYVLSSVCYYYYCCECLRWPHTPSNFTLYRNYTVEQLYVPGNNKYNVVCSVSGVFMIALMFLKHLFHKHIEGFAGRSRRPQSHESHRKSRTGVNRRTFNYITPHIDMFIYLHPMHRKHIQNCWFLPSTEVNAYKRKQNMANNIAQINRPYLLNVNHFSQQAFKRNHLIKYEWHNINDHYVHCCT